MSAVLKKKHSKKPRITEERYEVSVDPEDELTFRIDGELEFPVYSLRAAAKALGFTEERLTRIVERYNVKAKKRLVYKSGKKLNGYYLSDLVVGIVRQVEQSFLEPTKPQRDMEPEKYGPRAGFKGKVTEELRLTKARADKAELELHEAAGLLVAVADVVNDVGDMLSSFKARLLGLPPKLAAAAPPDIRAEIETNARGFINEALEEIAQYRPKVHRRAGSDDEAASDSEGQ